MKSIHETYRELVAMLPAASRRFLRLFMGASVLLALLDAVALGVLAVTVGPLASGGSLQVPGTDLTVSGGGLVAALVGVCALIVLKGGLSVLTYYAATRRFAGFEREIGNRLLAAYFAAPWTERLRRNSADLVRVADVGVSNTMNGFVLPYVGLVGEASTFVVVLLVLFVAQPLTAVSAIAYLGIVGAFLYLWVSRRAIRAGRDNLEHSHAIARLLTETVAALKEITLRNKADEISDVASGMRAKAAKARADIQFLTLLPRYVLEAALVVGFLIVGGVGYLTGGPAAAASSIAVFALAGFRLLPSLQRFQNILSQCQAVLPQARQIIADIRDFGIEADRPVPHSTRPAGPGPRAAAAVPSPAQLRFRDVWFAYPGAVGDDGRPADAVRGLDLTIPAGSSAAFVGPSGSGKSTVVDLLLGLMPPSRGRVELDGTPIDELDRSWRDRAGYVPQDVAVFDGTVGQNVALTWRQEYDRDRVWTALGVAQLDGIVRERAGGLDGAVGDRGLTLSGGQRQRLGIARALYNDPSLLVLDEATSALDNVTEAAINTAITEMHLERTVVLVAHRLSTVRHVDRIFFLDRGRLRAQGTFDELVATVPDFAAQAALAGITEETHG
ncbi:MAG: ABC transporter ATP-binding protein/permease [Micrococcales bacterium]|nr:ABC transporter ATP-binding protein/permease [Micrococcales bacterium]